MFPFCEIVCETVETVTFSPILFQYIGKKIGQVYDSTWGNKEELFSNVKILNFWFVHIVYAINFTTQVGNVLSFRKYNRYVTWQQR